MSSQATTPGQLPTKAASPRVRPCWVPAPVRADSILVHLPCEPLPLKGANIADNATYRHFSSLLSYKVPVPSSPTARSRHPPRRSLCP
jgi:hypothetical protein